LSFLKKKLVFEAHRFSPKRSFFYKRFKNKNFKVVVVTKRLREDFIKIGFKSENILIAPDGVDLAEFDIEISKEEARNRVVLPLDAKIVMYTGHLFEWKGADILLQVAKLISNDQFLISKNNEILFVFVGGTEHDIKSFIKKAEGLDNVLILGHKPHSQIPTYLKAADVLVLPNNDDEGIFSLYTSPLKLFEYMAAKRSIVASDLPSIREVLNDANAFLVKSGDPSALAEGICRAFLDNQKIEMAFRDVQRYAWNKRAGDILFFLNIIYGYAKTASMSKN
jgi:glycosyltransferase involved in cell wall biosynthesis